MSHGPAHWQPEDATDSTWKPVAPSSRGKPPPLPQAVKIGGIAGLVIVVIAAILLGIGLGGGFASSTASPTPELTMEPPVQIGSYVRGSMSTDDGGTLTRADYTDGTATIIVVMSWPQEDVATFMNNAGFGEAAPASESQNPTQSGMGGPGIHCGSTNDYAEPTLGCGTVERNTGLMVVGRSGQVEEEIRSLLTEFKQAVIS